jgi:hypothetical protein
MLRTLGIDRYAMYVHDYGAPIGWRLALGQPDAITAIITQNGNGYDAGFVESFWKTVWDYHAAQTADTEAAVRQFLTLDATRWQYVTGVADETLVDPESWYHDHALISRPGNDKVQLKLSSTTPPTHRCTHACTSTSAPAGCSCWRCGVAATKYSARPAHKPSPRTYPTPRSIFSTGGISCWSPHWRRWPGSSGPSLSSTARDNRPRHTGLIIP